MGLDLNKFLSMFKKSKKTMKKEDFLDENEDILEDFDEEDGEIEENKEIKLEENLNNKENEKNIDNGKRLMDKFKMRNLSTLKNKKIIISIAAVSVLVISGAIIAPIVMQYMGQKEAAEIGNISNIQSSASIIHHHNNNRNYNVSNYQTRGKKRIHIVNNALNSEKNNLYNINRKRHVFKNNRIKNIQKNKSKVISVDINSINNKTDILAKNRLQKVEQQIKKEDQTVKKIENHLLTANLTGKIDPVSLMDKTIIENRNFNNYLQSQIQLMRKLISYYKQKAELKKTLDLYKMAYYNNIRQNNNDNVNKENENIKLEETLRSIVAPLQQQINQLQIKLIEKEKKQENQKQKNQEISTNNFNDMAKLKLNDLNIFIKNGKYIAVVSTDTGDKIFEEGDYFNGYKIDKILPNMIVFEKNGQKFYYTYNQTLDMKYQVAKIKLPKSISGGEVSDNNYRKAKVKEYHAVSQREILRRLLQKRLKNIR